MLFQTLRFQNKSVSDFTIKLMIQLVLLTTLAPVVITAKGMMPITLQTLVILFGSIAFGWRIGFIATLLYLVLGFSGFPVFADYTSGITKLYGPYGGYFFGFLVAALVTGYLTELEMFSKQVTGIILWFILDSTNGEYQLVGRTPISFARSSDKKCIWRFIRSNNL
jgi:biotin transporter BioY